MKIIVVVLTIFSLIVCYQLDAMQFDEKDLVVYQKSITYAIEKQDNSALESIMKKLKGKKDLVQKIAYMKYKVENKLFGQPPLMVFCGLHYESDVLNKWIKFLVLHGCDINIRINFMLKNSALSTLVSRENFAGVKFFSLLGADPNLECGGRPIVDIAERLSQYPGSDASKKIYKFLKNLPGRFEWYMTEGQKEEHKDIQSYLYSLYEKRKYELSEIAARNRYKKKLLQTSMVKCLTKKRLCNISFKLNN